MAKFHFDSKEVSKNVYNFHYAAMSMMISQILQFVNFTKTQKYFKKEALFFLQIKKSSIAHQRLLYGKKYLCSGGNPFLEVVGGKEGVTFLRGREVAI